MAKYDVAFKLKTIEDYLDPFLDMFNGEILSYRLSKKTNAKAIIDALDETIEKTKQGLIGRRFILIKVGDIR